MFSHNERAIAAYKKVGFDIVKTIPDAVSYEGRSFDEIIMRQCSPLYA
nr:hypothetical protein [Exiguobacterium acetylicum]